jgi:site-specific DNA recombinase
MQQTSSQHLRAALYARYSSEKQRETSIVDQLRVARELAQRQGWRIVAEHADEGVSGSVPVALRRGGKALLADALAGRFDVLVVEGLDRLSREIGEAETITKRLEHRSIRIIGTADGYDSEARGRKVMRIARGLVNELYLDDLREKTHRGLAGQFDRGYHVGGVTYGYTTQLAPDGRSKVLAIDETKAAVVRRIFTMYVDGHSARGIVHQLNAEGVKAPRSGTWAVSALIGGKQHGAGVLNNELYTGRVIWNRRQWVKDPETGKRRHVVRPEAEWQVRDAPELRIVPAELWTAARARVKRGPATGTRRGGGQTPRALFSGLLRCQACAGPMVAMDGWRYGCSRRLDRGPVVCSNAQAFPRKRVEDVLLSMVREELLTPAALVELQRMVRSMLSEPIGGNRGVAAARAALRRVEEQIDRLTSAVADMGLSEALRARLTAAENERQELRAELDEAEQSPIELSAEEILAAHRRQVMQLRKALEEGADRDQARQLLADLVGPVMLIADEAGDLWAETEEPALRLAVAGSPTELVAGARFELATFGL